MNEPEQSSTNPDSNDLESRAIGETQVPSSDKEPDPETPLLGFVPTREEMTVLARHWAEEEHEFPLRYFLTGQTGGYEWRVGVYATGRLAQIRAAIGDRTVDEIVSRLNDCSRHSLGERGWDVFMNGTKEEKHRYQQEMWKQDNCDFDCKPPLYAVREIFDLAMTRLPEVPAKDVARALREAADNFERHGSRPSCEHVWKQEDPESMPECSCDGNTYWCERCEICAAIRECKKPTPQPDDVSDTVDP